MKWEKNKKRVAGIIWIIFLVLFQHAAAQHAAVNLQKKIVVPVGNIRFDSLFQQITRQTGVRFSLNTRKFPPSRTLHIQTGVLSLGNLLGAIREKTGIYYSVLGGHVIFIDNPPHHASSSPAPVAALKKSPAIKLLANKSLPPKKRATVKPLANPKDSGVLSKPLILTDTAESRVPPTSDTIQASLKMKIDTLFHKPDSVRSRNLLSAKRNQDTAEYIDASFLSFRNIRFPEFHLNGIISDSTYRRLTYMDIRPAFSLQWPEWHGLSFSFGGHQEDTTKDHVKEEGTPPASTSQTTTITLSKATGVTTSTDTRKRISFIQSTWNGLSNIHLPTIRLSGLQRNGISKEGGSRPLFSPVIKAGVSADETFYFNPTIQGGFRFLYGIVSWSTNMKASGLRYGAGISVGLSDDWRMHLTGTTGGLEKTYDTAGVQKRATAKISRIGLAAEKQLNDKWSLQFGIAYCLMRTTYYVDGNVHPPGMSDEALKQYLRPIQPPYVIGNNYDLGGAQHNQYWIGFQLGVYYNINFLKRR
ncbi:hypothetical protein [Chitinophaga dinghuensis]|uniref:hypothetical protein n=1 Tax=Chitinophaga dinghuensis TaxID=1539050 RepID=UPI000DBA13F9|nr:hypothetical protein [Chitinophaga dinghuensis]